MNILIVVAHPDDEVLGCGGTVSVLANSKHNVGSCILSARAEARDRKIGDENLYKDTERAHEILGVLQLVKGDFENLKFNLYPHIELVRFIESAIKEHQAEIIFTHHPFDLNNDHQITSTACQAAARLSQRNGSVPQLKGLYFMEILSSTDWAFPASGDGFEPDTFFPIGQALDKKLEALKAYKYVMRDFPHPRSEEIVRGLAAYRGGQAGMKYAEAFQVAFQELLLDK